MDKTEDAVCCDTVFTPYVTVLQDVVAAIAEPDLFINFGSVRFGTEYILEHCVPP